MCNLLKQTVDHFRINTILLFLDVNECKEKPCGDNAICTDTMGSFTCTCKEDYTGDPYKGCVGECQSIIRYFTFIL